MDILVAALQVGLILLVVYGGALCLWHRATEPLSEQRRRRYRGRRQLRLVHELGEPRGEEAPAELAPEPIALRKAA